MLLYVIYVLTGCVAAKLAVDRGRSGALWAFLAISLGPLALIAVLLLPQNTDAYVPSIVDGSGAQACLECGGPKEAINAGEALCARCFAAELAIAARPR